MANKAGISRKVAAKTNLTKKDVTATAEGCSRNHPRNLSKAKKGSGEFRFGTSKQ